MLNDVLPDAATEPEALLAKLPTATIHEAAGQTGDMAAGIRPVTAGSRVAGRAFTVRCLAGEALAVLHAIEAAPKGSVLVIDAGNAAQATIWGGTSSLACVMRGVAGCVTNAATRDVAEIRALGFPVFCAGVCVRGTRKTHPGWIGETVSVGERPVAPGDFIVGDDDGVVVIPAARIGETAARAQRQFAREEDRARRQRDGASVLEVLGLRPRESRLGEEG